MAGRRSWARAYMRRWRLAFLLASRDLMTHKVRTGLSLLLVAAPVFIGVTVTLVHHNSNEDGESLARKTIGGADALLEVTKFAQVEVKYIEGGEISTESTLSRTNAKGDSRPVRRDPASVNPYEILPSGSRLTPAPRTGLVELATGGMAQVIALDVDDPMSRGLVDIALGQSPSATTEVAVTRPMAEEFRLLESPERIRQGGEVQLASGRTLIVVGIIDTEIGSGNNPAQLVVAASSDLVDTGDGEPQFLVDLPAMTRSQIETLADSLAGDGIALMPRDVLIDPRAWGADVAQTPAVDSQALAAGAVAILIGSVEVLLLVGATFAISARRGMRDIGLLTANGGSPSDVRRFLLMQGLLIGALASSLAALGGIMFFLLAIPQIETLIGRTIWSREIDWLAVLILIVLGSLTAMVAALPPAVIVARYTPLEAISGRRDQASTLREERPQAPIVLLSIGAILLALSGIGIARTVTADERPGMLPLVGSVLGLVTLVLGAVLLAPYLVRWISSAPARFFPVSAQIALRDGARNRIRTAAASLVVAVAVTGSVLVAFGVDAVIAHTRTDAGAPPRSLSISLEDGSPVATDVTRVIATIQRVVGPVSSDVAYRAHQSGEPSTRFSYESGEGFRADIHVVDEAALRAMIGSPPSNVLDAFREGAVVTTEAAAVQDGSMRVGIGGQSEEDGTGTRALPSIAVDDLGVAGTGNFSTAWISADTARQLGLEASPAAALLTAKRTITPDDVGKISLYGIDASSPDAKTAWLPYLVPWSLALTMLGTMLIVGAAVALAGTEARDDLMILAAVGAGPAQHRAMGASRGMLVGTVGALLGLLIGVPSGLAFTQLSGAPGTQIPTLSIVVLWLVPAVAFVVGGLVTRRPRGLARRDS